MLSHDLETKTQKMIYLLRLLSTCPCVFATSGACPSVEATFPIITYNEATVYHLAMYVWEA